MSAMEARLAKLEVASGSKVFFRFLVIRGGKVTPEDEAQVLADHGETIGRNDIVVTEQHGDKYAVPPVAADEPLSLIIVASHTCIEDALDELDKEQSCAA